MIYKDLLSLLDKEDYPANRVGEVCLNCGEGFFFHRGWACNILATNTSFKDVLHWQRYETFSMAESIFLEDTIKISIKQHTKEKYDISDWRAWAHNVAGDCACGIKKHLCDYHK